MTERVDIELAPSRSGGGFKEIISNNPVRGYTNNQLNDWCQRKGVEGFQGVFPSNQVPRHLYRPDNACFILNHSPSTSSTNGTHWIACRVQGSHCNWFDSYGLPPDAKLEDELMGPQDGDPHFDEWLAQMGVETVDHNPIDLQSVTSEVCGLYACWFSQNGLPKDPETGKSRPHWRWVGRNRKLNDHMIQGLVRINSNL